MAGPPLARPTDAPPTAHRSDGRGRRAPATARRPRPTPTASCPTATCRATSRSSWTATAAGPASTAWPSSRATPPASRRSGRSSATRSAAASPSSRVYAFSRENWARSDDEVRGLFALLEQAIRSETAELKYAGRPDPAPRPARRAARRHPPVDRRGPRGDRRRRPAPPERRVQLRRPDRARRRVPADRRERRRPGRSIDETTIAEALYTAGLPDPDLVIRTGGEQRLSNFLIWQAAYAELYTTEVLWPDFGADAFDAALLEFASRTRRFGR